MAEQAALPSAVVVRPKVKPSRADTEKQADRPRKEGVLTIPATIEQHVLVGQRHCPPEWQVEYRPALATQCRLHYIRVSHEIDHWIERQVVQPVGASLRQPTWSGAHVVGVDRWVINSNLPPEGRFEITEPLLANARKYSTWRRQLVDHLYRSQSIAVWRCPELKLFSRAGESEDSFRVRLSQTAHERRDEAMCRLKDRYAAELAKIDDQIHAARERIDREASDYRHQSVDTAVSVGASILGALFGRKVLSRTNVNRASSSARKAGRVARQRSDVTRARKSLDRLVRKRQQLSAKIEREMARLSVVARPDQWKLERLDLKPRKSEMVVQPVYLLWLPWFVGDQGQTQPGYR